MEDRTKYYLTEIVTYTDGTADSTGLYTYRKIFPDDPGYDPSKPQCAENYDPLLDSLGSLYQKLGGAMKNDKYATTLLDLKDSTGNKIEYKFWARPIPAPAPEPEPKPEPEPETEPAVE